MSERDLRLIHALQIAPRVSWRDAAEVLEEGPHTLASRWRRLQRAGDAWVTVHPAGIPGSVSWIDIACVMDKRATVLSRLCSLPEVINIEETEDSGVVSVMVAADSVAVLRKQVLPDIARIPGVTGYEVSTCTRIHTAGNTWRLDSLDTDQAARMRAFRQAVGAAIVPPAEAKIYSRILFQNGRATAAEIQREVGGHPATVRRKLGQLLGSRQLVFRCELAQIHSGYPITCMWLAQLNADKHDEAAQILRSFRNLRMVASTTGASNFRFIMWLRAATEVHDVEVRIRSRVPKIELLRSSILPRQAKRMGWKVGPDTRAEEAIGFPF